LEEVADSPYEDLRLAANNGKRERIANSEEAAELLEALPAEDRLLWASALYGGAPC